MINLYFPVKTESWTVCLTPPGMTYCRANETSLTKNSRTTQPNTNSEAEDGRGRHALPILPRVKCSWCNTSKATVAAARSQCMVSGSGIQEFNAMWLKAHTSFQVGDAQTGLKESITWKYLFLLENKRQMVRLKKWGRKARVTIWKAGNMRDGEVLVTVPSSVHTQGVERGVIAQTHGG